MGCINTKKTSDPLDEILKKLTVLTAIQNGSVSLPSEIKIESEKIRTEIREVIISNNVESLKELIFEKLLVDADSSVRDKLKNPSEWALVVDGIESDEETLKKMEKFKSSTVEIILRKVNPAATLDDVVEIVTAMPSIVTNWKSNKVEMTKWLDLINEAGAGKWITAANICEDFTKFVLVLEKSIVLLSILGDDPSVFFICVPIYRLILEILIAFAFGINLIEQDKKEILIAMKPKLSSIMQMVQEIPSESINARLVVEIAQMFSTLLVDHIAALGGAVIQIIAGAVKSFIFMKVDEDLLKGLYRGMAAGFDIFKHYKADQQFIIINGLYPQSPLIDYKDLVNASKCMETIEGNWLLVSVYINNLVKHSFVALKALKGRGKKGEAMKVLRACIEGDNSVLGLCSILKKLDRKHKGQTLQKLSDVDLSDFACNAFMNGEYFGETIRKQINEAMGEVIESVEKDIESEVTECSKKFKSASTIENVTEQILQELKSISSTFDKIIEWAHVFKRAIQKATDHMKALQGMMDVIIKYANIIKTGLSCNDLNRHFKFLDSKRKEYVKVVSNFTVSTYDQILQQTRDDLKKYTTEPLQKYEEVLMMILHARHFLGCGVKQLEGILEEFVQIEVQLNEAKAHLNSITIIAKTNSDIDKSKINLPTFSSPGTKNFDINVSCSHIDTFLSTLSEFLGGKLSSSSSSSLSSVSVQSSSFSKQSSSLLSLPMNVLNFAVTAVGKAEKLFGDLSELEPAKLEQLVSGGAETLKQEGLTKRDEIIKSFNDSLNDSFKALSTTMMNANPGWWNSLSELWGVFGEDNEAFNTIREGAKTLFGPGSRPDLVQECAISAILELEPEARMLLQFDSISESNLDRRINDAVKSAVDRTVKSAVDRMGKETAKVRSKTKHANVKKLLNLDKHRPLVQHSVRQHWQSIEVEVMDLHTCALNGELAVRKRLEVVERSTKDQSKLHALVDAVPRVISECKNLEQVASTKEACKDLDGGPAGVSGLASSILEELNFIGKEMIYNQERIHDVVTILDIRVTDTRSSYSHAYVHTSMHTNIGSGGGGYDRSKDEEIIALLKKILDNQSHVGGELRTTREFRTSPSDVRRVITSSTSPRQLIKSLSMRSVITSSTSPRQLIKSLSMHDNTMHKLKIEQKIRQKTPVRGHPQPEYHSNLPTMLRGSTREVLSHHMRTGSKPSKSLKIEDLVHRDPDHISSRWNTVAERVSGWHGVSSEYSRTDASESQSTASGFSASSGVGLTTITAPPPSLSKSTGHDSGHKIGAAMYGVQGSFSKSNQKARVRKC